MLYGGLLGFMIGIGFGVAQGSAWPDAIWRGSVVALGAGLLLRWWGGLWVKVLAHSHQPGAQRERGAEGRRSEAIRN